MKPNWRIVDLYGEGLGKKPPSILEEILGGLKEAFDYGVLFFTKASEAYDKDKKEQ